MRFKVGDLVRCIEAYEHVRVGDVGTVERVVKNVFYADGQPHDYGGEYMVRFFAHDELGDMWGTELEKVDAEGRSGQTDS